VSEANMLGFSKTQDASLTLKGCFARRSMHSPSRTVAASEPLRGAKLGELTTSEAAQSKAALKG
jgi:hypothetical protein